VVILNFADSSSGIGALGFSGTDFLVQLITFVLAYLILRRYAFGPIIKMMNQRRETIESSVKLAEDLKKEQAELEANVEKALFDARKEADGIIASAQDTGRETIRDAEEKAKTKAASILAEADDRIKQDTALARKNLEKELVGLVSDTTEAIINEKLDAKKDAQLIERMLGGKQTA
jgi:F-type H+-transporting ATPase subunit b